MNYIRLCSLQSLPKFCVPGISSSRVQCQLTFGVPPVREYTNSNRVSICRTGRLQFVRTYPTLLVNPDGSTVTIRYFEPRRIIRLPIDISDWSEAQKKAQLEKRRPKTRVTLEEDAEMDSFNANKYLTMVKK